MNDRQRFKRNVETLLAKVCAMVRVNIEAHCAKQIAKGSPIDPTHASEFLEKMLRAAIRRLRDDELDD